MRLEQENSLVSIRERIHNKKRQQAKMQAALEARKQVIRRLEEHLRGEEVEELSEWDQAVNWHIEQCLLKDRQQMEIHEEIEREMEAQRDRHFQNLWDQKCQWEQQQQNDLEEQKRLIYQFKKRHNLISENNENMECFQPESRLMEVEDQY